jgi:hypothetical protein
MSGSEDNGCGCVVFAIIFAPLILAIYSWGLYPWVVSSVQFPVRYCGDQVGAGVISDDDVFYCPNGTFEVYNETYRIGISPNYASILSRSGGSGASAWKYPSQSVKWSEFTPENMCNKASLIYQQYSLPNNICSQDGKLLVGGSYISPALAAIATMVMFPIFVFGSLKLLELTEKHDFNKRTAVSLSFALLMGAFVPAVFAMYSWNRLGVPMNYLSGDRIPNVAPIYNVTFVLAVRQTSPHRYSNVYEIEKTNEIVSSPLLYNSYAAEGYNIWGGAIAVLVLDSICVLALAYYIFMWNRGQSINIARTETAAPTPPIVINDPQFFSQEDDLLIQKNYTTNPVQVPSNSGEDGEDHDAKNDNTLVVV